MKTPKISTTVFATIETINLKSVTGGCGGGGGGDAGAAGGPQKKKGQGGEQPQG